MCLDEPARLAFVPCGHLASCEVGPASEISTWLAATVVLSHFARFARSRCPTHGRDVQCADVEVSWSTWRVGWLGERLGDPVWSCFSCLLKGLLPMKDDVCGLSPKPT